MILDKIKLLGATPDTVSWFQSYLEGRYQLVEIDAKQSSVISMPPCSVIQGSIGSCLLYTVLTIDLPWALHENHQHDTDSELQCEDGVVSTYVDDTSAVLTADTPEQLGAKTQTAAVKIEQYLDDNLLKANRDKSKLTVSSEDCSAVVVRTCEKPIRPQSTLKLLGVYISKDLTWNKQVSVLIQQLNYRVHILRMIAHYCSMKTY